MIYCRFTIGMNLTHSALLAIIASPPSALFLLSFPPPFLFLLFLLFRFCLPFLRWFLFLWSRLDACSTGSVLFNPCQVIFDPHIKPWREVAWCKKWKMTWAIIDAAHCSTVEHSATQCKTVQVQIKKSPGLLAAAQWPAPDPLLTTPTLEKESGGKMLQISWGYFHL